MASDLQKSYPGIKGFSRSSLFAMRQFYAFFGSQFEIVPQPVGQLPWGHVRTMLAKVKSVEDVLFYAQACVEQGWSRTVLEWQIEQRFHERMGKVVGNFLQALPAPQSELVQQSLKDPYVFDFLTLTPQAVERDIENQLVTQITRFLLELACCPLFRDENERIRTCTVSHSWPLNVGKSTCSGECLPAAMRMRRFVFAYLLQQKSYQRKASISRPPQMQCLSLFFHTTSNTTTNHTSPTRQRVTPSNTTMI
jgi:predicted nuclease of restriction endonuclease-like (RecB) superfamily